jgi:hypothetical protein
VLLRHLKINGFLFGDEIHSLGDMREDVFRSMCQSGDVINAITALDDSWLDPFVSVMESKGCSKDFVKIVKKKIVSARISSLDDLVKAITPAFLRDNDLPQVLYTWLQDRSVLEKIGISGCY